MPTTQGVNTEAGTNAAQLHKARDRFKEAANALKNDFEKLGKVTKDLTDDQWHQLQENMSDYYQRGQDSLQQLEEKLESQIRKYPAKALMIAVAAGFILGWLRRQARH